MITLDRQKTTLARTPKTPIIFFNTEYKAAHFFDIREFT